MKKQPVMITPHLTNLEGTESAKAYLGKQVYTASGDKAGRIKDLVIKENEVAGLIIKGRHLLFIDKDHCAPGTADTVLLTIDPVVMLKGKFVFDNNGKKLGRVKGIERKSMRNTCEELIVKKNIFTKTLRIPAKDIEVAKKNIILNKSY